MEVGQIWARGNLKIRILRVEGSYMSYAIWGRGEEERFGSMFITEEQLIRHGWKLDKQYILKEILRKTT